MSGEPQFQSWKSRQKVGTRAVLLGQDFQKYFEAADGLLWVYDRDKLQKKLSVNPWKWDFLKILCWAPKNEASSNTGSLSAPGRCAGGESLWRLTLQGLRNWEWRNETLLGFSNFWHLFWPWLLVWQGWQAAQTLFQQQSRVHVRWTQQQKSGHESHFTRQQRANQYTKRVLHVFPNNGSLYPGISIPGWTRRCSHITENHQVWVRHHSDSK